MIRWLWRRWRRRKGVFYYHDGLRERCIDPVLAVIALDEHPVYVPEVHGPGIDDGDPEAVMKAAEAVRDVFHIKQVAEGGLTINEQITLLYQFQVYVELQKKSSEASRTPPAPTASISSDSSEETEKPTTDSGSTSSEPSSERPTECEEPSTPPSKSDSEVSDTEKAGSLPQRSTRSVADTCISSTK